MLCPDYPMIILFRYDVPQDPILVDKAPTLFRPEPFSSPTLEHRCSRASFNTGWTTEK